MWNLYCKLITIICCLFYANELVAQDYYVSVLSGNDDNLGTYSQPFKTISQAVKKLKPGDTCFVMQGHYREVVHINLKGTTNAPITISAYHNEKVVFDGAEPLDVSASREVSVDGKDYVVVKTPELFDQLFRGDQMLIEARWPNMNIHDGSLWAADAWAKTKQGSRYGYIVDVEIPEEFSGKKLRAKLNVGHRFFTWSRPVIFADPKGKAFTYSKDLPGLGEYLLADKPWKKKVWEEGQYYFYDSLALLDQVDEWFLDQEKRELYFLKGASLADLSFKKRSYGMIINDSSNLNIHGIDFYATTFKMLNCNRCSLEDSDIKYPVYIRSLAAEKSDRQSKVRTLVSGKENRINNVHISFSNAGGIELRGYANVLENSTIHDVSWDGSLMNPAVKVDAIRSSMLGGKNMIIHNNIYNAGSVLVDVENVPNNIIAYNHIYRGGLASGDVSLIYTQNPSTVGTNIHHNWVHDSPSASGGMCIRGDDQSRGLRIHHNIVWGCSGYGLVLKGDNHTVYNNTFFNNGKADILLRMGSEKEKPWRKQWPLLRRQNMGTILVNNHYRLLRKDNKRLALKLKKFSNNVTVTKLPQSFDTKKIKFQPDYGNYFCDKGEKLSNIKMNFAGKAPDIGSIECGVGKWRAGH